MTTRLEIDQQRLDAFERSLLSGTAIRVAGQDLWRAMAQVFAQRRSGPPERRLLLEAHRSIEARGAFDSP